MILMLRAVLFNPESSHWDLLENKVWVLPHKQAPGKSGLGIEQVLSNCVFQLLCPSSGRDSRNRSFTEG